MSGGQVTRKRIAIVGCGFAGMWAALAAVRALDENGPDALAEVEVVVIAPEPRVHIRPRLYEEDLTSLAPSVEALFELVGVRFVHGSVHDIAPATRQVFYTDGAGESRALVYDRLVVASGSQMFSPNLPGLATHAFDVDQLGGAQRLQDHMRGLAELPASSARDTVVVVGGGFTGIETATEMPSRLRRLLGEDADVRVIVVEQHDAIGPDLGPGPRPIIEEALTALGVECRLGTAVSVIDAEGVFLASGERLHSHTVIWTAGLRASPLTKKIEASRDPGGRLSVDRDLRVTGASDVFAAGDVAAAYTDDADHLTMMSCQHAMNLGRSAGHNVACDLLGRSLRPYSQPKYVTCLDLGPWGAVYTEGWDRQVKLTGREAKNLKHAINTEYIYPPTGSRAEVLALADPARVVVA